MIMNYEKIYNQLISSRLTATTPAIYHEVHHIIPRALGGGDEKSNLIKLSAREHFIAHRLLAKIHGGAMWHALNLMKGRVDGLTSHVFAVVRENAANAHSEIMKGRSPSNKGKKAPAHLRKKLSEAHKGKKLSSSHRSKVIAALTRRERDDEWSSNISKSLIGHKVSQITRDKISESLKGSIPHNRGKNDKVVQCPHCGKEGGQSVMKRWHFEKCKLIQNNH